MTPNKPNDKTFDELIEVLRKHYSPKPNIIVCRFRFNTSVRNKGESVASYVARLQQLSEHCTFGTELNDMLRDRLVCGINHVPIQKRLFAESNLTFKKAFEIAQAMESVEKNAEDLQREGACAAASQGLASSKPGQSNYMSNPKAVHKKSKQQTYTQKGGTNSNTSSSKKSCYRCLGDHNPNDCKFKTVTCHKCKKYGHIAVACKSGGDSKGSHNKRKYNRAHHMSFHQGEEEQLGSNDNEYDYLFSVHSLNKPMEPPVWTEIKIDDKSLKFEIDTGSPVTLISEDCLKNHYSNLDKTPVIEEAKDHLLTYTSERIQVKGRINVKVSTASQTRNLSLVVVPGSGPSLLGRDWLKTLLGPEWKEKLLLDWQAIHKVTAIDLSQIMDKYDHLFNKDLGTFVGVQARIHVPDGTKPCFYKARPVPYAIREKVDHELTRLESLGIIEKIQFSNWATPIVPVIKPDGSIRICGDYRVTVNKSASVDKYPIPRIEDLQTKLSGGLRYTKLDMSNAYLQMTLEESSREYTTINTHRGLFRYCRLPFGVSSAPSIWQRAMDSLFQDMSNVAVYLDDIVITGSSDEEHLQTLETVFERLSKAGLRLKKEKCSFFEPEVIYLGHRINAKGLHPTKQKIQAIYDAPPPKNVTELKAYLGLVNYYGKYIGNVSTLLAPLYKLLQKGQKWIWEKEQRDSFRKSKTLLTSDTTLAHFDPEKEIILSCDASPYGVGAVISHLDEDDGSLRPIAFASRTLNAAEKNYSQLDKEGLAITFGVKRFHQFLYGRMFTIESDHKPLIHIFSDNKCIPQMASARLQRWALLLSAYQYKIKYKPGLELANADGLSRLPSPESPNCVPVPGSVLFVQNQLSKTIVKVQDIKQATSKDPIMSKVLEFVKYGFPNEPLDGEFKVFFNRKEELSVEDGCILWGNRVVVPPIHQKAVLLELHQGHPGITRMKALARCYVWWPGIDTDLESVVRQCSNCQQIRKSPPDTILHPWEWPGEAWSRIHIDYAGPIKNQMLLIIVDAYTKWIDVHITNSTSTQVTVEKLRKSFADHGLPQTVVSDNGSCFTSEEFRTFIQENGLKHILVSPYRPASNGLAERAVQTVKEGIRKIKDGSLENIISRFLFSYRVTPQSTTGIAPCELMCKHKFKTRLDSLKPNLRGKVIEKQESQKCYHDSRSKPRHFYVGDNVYTKNFSNYGDYWLEGVIVKVCGPVSYMVELKDGRIIRRHLDHLRGKGHEENTHGNQADLQVSQKPKLNLDTYTPGIIPVGPEDKSSTNQENISDENMDKSKSQSVNGDKPVVQKDVSRSV